MTARYRRWVQDSREINSTGTARNTKNVSAVLVIDSVTNAFPKLSNTNGKTLPRRLLIIFNVEMLLLLVSVLFVSATRHFHHLWAIKWTISITSTQSGREDGIVKSNASRPELVRESENAAASKRGLILSTTKEDTNAAMELFLLLELVNFKKYNYK